MWDKTELLKEERGWRILPENGWGALIAWTAGEQNRRMRVLDDSVLSSRLMRVEVIQRGISRKREVPFTPSDQEEINDSIAEYLQDADVPSPPSGYQWFVRIPDGLPDDQDVLEVIGEQAMRNSGEAPSPREWRTVFEEIFRTFYV